MWYITYNMSRCNHLAEDYEDTKVFCLLSTFKMSLRIIALAYNGGGGHYWVVSAMMVITLVLMVMLTWWDDGGDEEWRMQEWDEDRYVFAAVKFIITTMTMYNNVQTITMVTTILHSLPLHHYQQQQQRQLNEDSSHYVNSHHNRDHPTMQINTIMLSMATFKFIVGDQAAGRRHVVC